jgi:hypothetical protein
MATATRALIGHTTEAFGADPSDVDRTYQFRYKVVALDDLIPSHTDSLSVNPRYPGDLQPRIRERAASRLQINTMAENLNPKVLLRDTGFLDTGPMIVGPDDVVESGNGRVLALRRAAQDYPAKYRLYRSMLINQATTYGLSEDDIEAVNTPVLVRERITKVDRAKFAAEANASNVLAMSPFEQAVQDAGRLSSGTIQSIEVGDDESIDQALRRKANAPIVAKFYDSIPANERASIVDSKGEITASGLNRLKLAIFTKTYQGDAGQRLARTFSESVDPNIKNIEAAMFQSLPDMAKAEALITTGARDKELSVAPDLAKVVETYSTLKQTGTRIDDYLKQREMFEQRLDATQRAMLEHLDSIARSPKKVREFTRDVATAVITAPPKEQGGGMFGNAYEITKEKIVNASINKQRTEAGKEPIEIASRASSQELAKPDAGRTGGAGPVPEGLGSAGGLQPEAEIHQAGGVSAQTGLMGFGHEAAQSTMMGEWGTAAGAGGHKETLVDVEKIKEAAAAAPLPGQHEMIVDKKPVIADKKPENIGNKPKLSGTQTKATKPAAGQVVVKTTTNREGPTVSRATIEQRQDERSAQAKAMDLAQQHSVVVPADSPRVNRWVHDPGAMDVQDVDTRRVGIRQVPDKPRKEKPMYRINRRRGGGGRGIDMGADIVRDRRGRHLRL